MRGFLGWSAISVLNYLNITPTW